MMRSRPSRKRRYLYRPPRRQERQQRVIKSLRPLDFAVQENEHLKLRRVLIFHEAGNIVVSLVTNCGTSTVTMSPDMIGALGRRMLKAAKGVEATVEYE